MADIAPGQILSGRYKILRLLGTGGVSSVFLAEDQALNTKWAIKRFHTSHLGGDEKSSAEEQYSRELKILSKLTHPLLPRIADSFSEGGESFIVLEYVEGETLAETMMRLGRPVPEEEVKGWALDICDVLEYLHSQKPPVIYRDLKPQNLILTRGGGIKFIDFGIARILNPARDKDTIFMGTPGYSPPEQFGKGQTDERSDIYSFGATLFHLLTARDPGENPFHFDPVSKYNSEVSPLMEQVVARAVEMEPQNRFATVRQMRQVLTGEKKPEDLPSPPWIVVDPPEISFENIPHGKTLRQTLRVKSASGSPIKIRVRGQASFIDVEREHLYGTEPEINISFNTKLLSRRDDASTGIEIITDAMKVTVPVAITFIPPLERRLPDWLTGLLLLGASMTAGILWHVTTVLAGNIHDPFLLRMKLILLFLALTGMALFYRGRLRIYMAITITLCAALMLAGGESLKLILFFAYCLFISRILIKGYHRLRAAQQQELKALYMIALGVPTLIYAAALYSDSFYISPDTLWHSIPALLINALIVLFGMERWKPALTQSISTSGIGRLKYRIWERGKILAGWIFFPFIAAVIIGAIWGALANLNVYVLNGNLSLLPILGPQLFGFELWSFGLPFAIPHILGIASPLPWSIALGCALGLLVALALTGIGRLHKAGARVFSRALLACTTANLFILGMIMGNIYSQRDIYYLPPASLKEAHLKRIAISEDYSPELRFYSMERLARRALENRDFAKALYYLTGITKIGQLIPDMDSAFTSQGLFLRGLCQFYLGRHREALLKFDELLSGDQAYISNAFTIEGGFYLDISSSGTIPLVTPDAIKATTYYYDALCKEQLLSYRDMTDLLEESLKLSESLNDPVLGGRTEEIRERLAQVKQAGLDNLKTGEALYDDLYKKKAKEMHEKLAAWLNSHKRADLGKFEEALAGQLQ